MARITFDLNTYLTAEEAMVKINKFDIWPLVVEAMDNDVQRDVLIRYGNCPRSEFLDHYLELAPKDLFVGRWTFYVRELRKIFPVGVYTTHDLLYVKNSKLDFAIQFGNTIDMNNPFDRYDCIFVQASKKGFKGFGDWQQEKFFPFSDFCPSNPTINNTLPVPAWEPAAPTAAESAAMAAAVIEYIDQVICNYNEEVQ